MTLLVAMSWTTRAAITHGPVVALYLLHQWVIKPLRKGS